MLGVVVTLIISGCSGGDNGSDASLGTLPASTTTITSSTSTSVTTSSSPTTEAATTTVASSSTSPPTSSGGANIPGAVKAWTNLWTSTPNPRPDGSLRGTATPQAKQDLATFLYGPGTQGPPTDVQSHPTVSAPGEAVLVTDCVISQPTLSGSPDQAGVLVKGEVRRRPNGWRVTSLSLPGTREPCVPASLVSEPRNLWIRDLELELGLPKSLEQMDSMESDELFDKTRRYARAIEEAGGSYQGERELHPVVTGLSFDEQDRMVITFRSCHTYSEDFGIVADGEMLTDLYDPERRRSDTGEVTRFDEGWLVTSVEGSRRPCEPGDQALPIVGG